MGPSISFDRAIPVFNGRPWTVVALHGPGGTHGRWWRVQALLDTGADTLHLPSEAASAVGLDPRRNALRVRLASAGGPIDRWRLPAAVEIEGVRVTIDVLFGPGVMPLVGRDAMFAVMSAAGFTSRTWLPKRHGVRGSGLVPRGVAGQPGARPAARITVHDTWVDIGGVRVPRRDAPAALLRDGGLVAEGRMTPHAFDERYGPRAWDRVRGTFGH